MQPERSSGANEQHRKRASIVPINGASGMVWRGPDYPLLSPGKYTVRGSKVQGPEWVRSFQRWSLRIEFALVSEPGLVSAFFNLGADKSTKVIGRQSRYFRAWAIANGGPPFRGQEMSADVFLEGQFFEVQVERCDTDSRGEPKQEAEVYSRITRILRAWAP